MALFLAAGVWVVPDISSAEESVATWTTTADFDSGMKSLPGDGNYGVETYTDNVRVASNSFELSNIKGDSFTLYDLDGTTFKWTEEGRRASGTGDPCISHLINSTTNSYYVFYTLDSISLECDIGSVASVSGDIDISIKGNTPTNGANRFWALCLYNEKDIGCNDDFANLDSATVDGVYYYYIVDNELRARTVTDRMSSTVGSTTTLATVTCLRITRVSTTVTWYYSTSSTCASWVQDETTTFSTSSSLYFYLSAGDSSAADGNVILSRFSISGTVGAGGYRTTGNWISPTIPIPENRRIDYAIITYSGVSANGYIDKVKFIRNGTTDQEFDTDIISGTTTRYNATSVLRGLSNFNLQVYLAGSGSTTVTIESIQIYLSAIDPISSDPTEILILILLLMVFIFLFLVGLYERFAMVGASIVAVFVAIQAWIMTENVVLPAFFVFIFGLCIALSITKRQ